MVKQPLMRPASELGYGLEPHDTILLTVPHRAPDASTAMARVGEGCTRGGVLGGWLGGYYTGYQTRGQPEASLRLI